VPGVLEVFLDRSETATLSVPIDLTNIAGANILDANGAAWVGFTAATGAAYENHDIFGWSLTLTPPSLSVR